MEVNHVFEEQEIEAVEPNKNIRRKYDNWSWEQLDAIPDAELVSEGAEIRTSKILKMYVNKLRPKRTKIMTGRTHFRSERKRFRQHPYRRM